MVPAGNRATLNLSIFSILSDDADLHASRSEAVLKVQRSNWQRFGSMRLMLSNMGVCFIAGCTVLAGGSAGHAGVINLYSRPPQAQPSTAAPAKTRAPAPAPTQNACEREMIRAAREFKVPVNILYAVGLTETGNRGSLQPYAMNIEGKAYFATSPQDAIRRLNTERAQGVKAD